jgi:tRNA-specific adenosine deaminase 1
VSPENVYLKSVVIPESQYSAAACDRSFSATGRMSSISDSRWPGGYSFVPFKVNTTKTEFHYSQREVASRSERKEASNLAAAWTSYGLAETMIGGVLQGRKQFHPKGASSVSRRKFWELSKSIAAIQDVGTEAARAQLDRGSYRDVKDGVLNSARQAVKNKVRTIALTGWTRNSGDDSFGL